MATKTLDMHGDNLQVTWDGNTWVSPCNGQQHSHARNAMRAELERYLLDCGEDTDEMADEIEGHLDRMTDAETKISISRDGIWAGDGRLVAGSIEDCPAVLGDDQDASDETYEAIESAIEDGESSIERPDGTYTWTITAE